MLSLLQKLAQNLITVGTLDSLLPKLISTFLTDSYHSRFYQTYSNAPGNSSKSIHVRCFKSFRSCLKRPRPAHSYLQTAVEPIATWLPRVAMDAYDFEVVLGKCQLEYIKTFFDFDEILVSNNFIFFQQPFKSFRSLTGSSFTPHFSTIWVIWGFALGRSSDRYWFLCDHWRRFC